MAEHTSIVIIGGGIVGVCTAYYIARDPRFCADSGGSVSLTLVEAHEIAGGASGKAGGFLARDWHGAATRPLAALSYALHDELSAELDGPRTYGHRRLTSLSCRVTRAAASPQPPPQENPALADSDLEFRTKPPGTATLAEVGWLRGAQGPPRPPVSVVAGEDTTAQVHPALFTKRLFDAAAARGVRYVRGRPRRWRSSERVLEIDTPGDGVHALRADRVVLAAGPWTARVAAELFGAAVPVRALPGHSVLIRPPAPLPAHAVFASVYGARDDDDVTGTPEIFARPDGLVYVAGENTGPPLPEGTRDVRVQGEAIQKLVKAAGLVSAVLRDGVVEAEQLCYRPVTPHGTPLIGELSSTHGGVYVAAGHGPWGITLGPGTGKVMSELVLDAGYVFLYDRENRVLSDIMQDSMFPTAEVICHGDSDS